MNYMEKYIISSVQNVKELIDKGDLTIESPLIKEQKEKLIDNCLELQIKNGANPDRTSIGLIIDKMFADILGVNIEP